ncbi:MAG: hypothetical protein WCD89_10205 [Anaerocolumna sp.]
MMKKKFETYYMLKIGVNNVDIFVDKYVFRHRICGILLSTWENIGGQILMLCLLVGSISTIIGLIYECGKQQILSTFSVGILTSGLLIFLEGLINLSGRKELIRLNMKDYLENILKVRLEQEQVQPELIEQYKKEYLREEAAQAMNSSELMAAASEKSGKLTRKEKKDKHSGLKVQKLRQKRQQKEALRSEKINKKMEKKVAEIRKKEEKQLVKEKKKMLKVQSRQKAREEEERIKKETKLALERKREAERAEIERIKAEVKANEEHKKEEKRRQEELKKTLLLEKKALKDEKNKTQPIEYKTIAQERKENLKREVRERRNLKSQEDEKDIILYSRQDDKIAIALMDEKPMEVKTFAESVAEEKPIVPTFNTEKFKAEKVIVEKAHVEKPKVEKAQVFKTSTAPEARVQELRTGAAPDDKAQGIRSSAVSEEKTQINKTNSIPEEKVKPVINRKSRPAVSEDEKLIEDILKEFLA